MGMTVKRFKDEKTPKVFMHKIADVRGGVSVKSSELGKDYLKEGAVLSAPTDGICNVVKVAKVVAVVTATGKTINVEKFHNFAVGNFVMKDVGGLAYAITTIDTTNSAYDVITVGTTLGAFAIGDFLIEASAGSAADTSALKYTPFAIVGTGKLVLPNENIDTDAWVIGVTKGNKLPDCVTKYLTGIINY